MNGDDSGDEDTLKGFYAYKNTFDDETVWVDIPHHGELYVPYFPVSLLIACHAVTFINTTNPYLDPLTPEFDAMSAASMDSPAPFEPRSVTSWPTRISTPSSFGPEQYSRSGTSAPSYFTPPDFDTLPPLETGSMLQSPPMSTAGTPISPQGSISNHHFQSMLNNSCMTPPPIDPRLTSQFECKSNRIPRSVSVARQTPSNGFDHMNEQHHEIAFLMRWFSEGPGYWMDLFDFGTYFASYVPVKARDNAMLRYAALAYSAKALARVQGRKPIMGGSVTHQACMELYPDSQSVDWYHKATEYYDTAVSLLLQALKEESIITSESESDCEQRRRSSEVSYSNGSPSRKRRRTSSSTTSYKSSTDELLAASAILCVYEFLDASVPEWKKHLNGAKSLLVIAQERMMPLQIPTPNSTVTTTNLGFISKARRATFWNIARQDMLAACKSPFSSNRAFRI
jgi:hypothetical protein